MRRSDVIRRLTDAGHGSVPPPSPHFLDALELRLRDSDARTVPDAVGAWRAGQPTRSPRMRRLPALGVAAAAAVLLAMPGPAHRLLLEGGPQPQASQPQSIATTPDAPDAPAGPSVAPAVPAPTGSASPQGVPTATPSGAPTPDPSAAPTQGAEPPPTTAPDSATPAPESPPPTESATPESAAYGYAAPTGQYAIGASARLDDRGAAHVSWSVFDHGEFDSYVVLRTRRPHLPAWPRDDRTEVVARVDRSGPTSLVDENPGPERPTYRIVVLDADGNEVGRSRAVIAEDPPPSGEEPAPGDPRAPSPLRRGI